MNVLPSNPDHVASIARRFLGEPNRRLSTRREWRYGNRGSLAVALERGVFFDHESGASGGILDLIVYAGAARDRGEAARLLETTGAIPGREACVARHRRPASEASDRARRVACAAALWRAGKPIAGTVGEVYLRRTRAVSAPLEAAAVRFLPAAPLTPYAPDHRRRPAIIAAVRDAGGKISGAHLTFIRPDGRGKADVSAPRKMLGETRGGHVPLICGARLVVAEGIESSFSAWEAALSLGVAPADDLGAIAGLSAGGVAALIWPVGTTGLVIAPDNDRSGTGERAAQALASRALAAGLSAMLLRPPEGVSDWNAGAMGRLAHDL